MSALKVFLAIWFGYFLLIAVNPIVSNGSGAYAAFLLQFLFVVVAGFWWGAGITIPAGTRGAVLGAVDDRKIKRVIYLGIALSAFGTIAIAADRILLQGVDYSEGIAVARQQWRKIGEGRDGISSVWSVLGYLLSTSFVVSMWGLISHFEKLSRKYFARNVTLIFFLLMINSVLIGGRSIILLALAFALAFYCLRRARSFGRLRLGGKVKRRVALAGLAILFFLNYVFYARALTNDVGGFEYMVGMVGYLGAKPADIMVSLHESFPVLADIVSYNVLVVTYLTHSFYTTAAIIEVGGGDTFILFGYVRQLLSKLQVIGDVNLYWFLAGRFPSLPGALYHDGGAILSLIGACISGILAGGASFYSRRSRPSVIGDGMVASIFVVMFLSPFVLAVDIMSFPFIVAEFLLIGFLARFRLIRRV